MSLTPAQRAATASELAANIALSGLDHHQLMSLSGLPHARFAAALAVEQADPADVWLLRDTVERAVLAAGATPVPFSVLTDAARTSAGVWFGVPTDPVAAPLGGAMAPPPPPPPAAPQPPPAAPRPPLAP